MSALWTATGVTMGRMCRPFNMALAAVILAALTPFLVALAVCFHVGSGACWALGKMGVRLAPKKPAQDPAQVALRQEIAHLREAHQFALGMALKAPTQQEVNDAIRMAWGEVSESHETATAGQWSIAVCRAILAGRREDRGI